MKKPFRISLDFPHLLKVEPPSIGMTAVIFITDSATNSMISPFFVFYQINNVVNFRFLKVVGYRFGQLTSNSLSFNSRKLSSIVSFSRSHFSMQKLGFPSVTSSREYTVPFKPSPTYTPRLFLQRRPLQESILSPYQRKNPYALVLN